MRFTTEITKRNRLTVPPIIVQGLSLKRGDFVEITIEIVKRATKEVI